MQSVKIAERKYMARRTVTKQAPPLQRDAIVSAAIKVLDNDGYSNLTLRRVASELNVQAPALYWHIKDKTALIDHMAEMILQAEFAELVARKSDETWQEWLMDTMKRLRKVMWSHRDGGRVVTGAHLSPAFTLVKLFDLSIESLVSAGISVQTAGQVTATIVHFVFGRVIEEQSSPAPEQINMSNVSKLFVDYPYFLDSIKKRTGHDEFEESLRIIIDGASLYVDRLKQS